MNTTSVEAVQEPFVPRGLQVVLDASREFIEFLPMAAYACDEWGRILWFNERAAALWGRKPRIGNDSELYCGSWRLFFDGREISRNETPMAIALRTGEAVEGAEGMVERPDGSRVWATAHVQPVKDATGRVCGAINCFHDTTELHQAKAEVAERDAYTRRILDAMPAAIYTTDEAGRITYYNQAAVKLAGREPTLDSDEWCVTWKLYWPDGTPLPHKECPMALALKEQRPNRGMEAVAERPDGSRVPILPYPSPLFDASGKLTGAVNMLVDISERKSAEEALCRNQAWLGGQKEAFQAAMNGTPLESSLGLLIHTAVEQSGSGRRCAFYIVNPEGTALHHVVGMPPHHAQNVDGFKIGPESFACGLAAHTGQAVITPDVLDAPLWKHLGWLAAMYDFRACWSFPVQTASGKVVGTLAIYCKEPGEPTARDRELAAALLHAASIIISRHQESEAREQAMQALMQSQRELATELIATRQLQAISAELILEQDDQALYRELVDAAAAIVGSDCASMQMLHPDRGENGELHLLAAHGFTPEALRFWEWVRADSGCTCGEAMRTGRRAIAADVATCDFMAGADDSNAYLEAGILAAQSTPLLSRAGHLLGMISTHWRHPHEPGENDLQRLDVLARLAADLIERRQAADALRQSEERFRAFVTTSSDAVYRMSPDWREMLRLDGNDFIPDTHKSSCTWMDRYIPPDDQPVVMEAIRDAVHAQRPFDLEHRVVRVDGALGWIHSRAIPLLGADGEIIEWFGTATDVTERKRAEERQTLLVNELNHRVKNTLATVQSLAYQTLRNSRDTDQALQQLDARLIALSKAHNVLTREHWKGASLRRIIEDGLAPYGGASLERFDVAGPDVWLPPKHALALAMALHELCTNAVKYGALSLAGGSVRIAWEVADGDGSQALQIRWIETGGPPVNPPSRRGFGSRLIERGLQQDLDGEVQVEYARTGVICRIEAALVDASGMGEFHAELSAEPRTASA